MKENEDLTLGEIAFFLGGVAIILYIIYFIVGNTAGFLLGKTDSSHVYEYVLEDGELKSNMTLKVDRGAWISTLAFVAGAYVDTTSEDEYITVTGKKVSLAETIGDKKMLVNSTGKDLYIKLKSYGNNPLKDDIPTSIHVPVDNFVIVIGYVEENIGCDELLPNSSYDTYEYWIGMKPYHACKS